jgi:uncharacterized protein YjiS (DUF1127 family)
MPLSTSISKAFSNKRQNIVIHFCISAPQQFALNSLFQSLTYCSNDSIRVDALQCNMWRGVRHRNERFAMVLSHLVRLLRSWRRYNSSMSELYNMSDRDLADIGISRSDIPRIAWEASQR